LNPELAWLKFCGRCHRADKAEKERDAAVARAEAAEAKLAELQAAYDRESWGVVGRNVDLVTRAEAAEAKLAEAEAALADEKHGRSLVTHWMDKANDAEARCARLTKTLHSIRLLAAEPKHFVRALMEIVEVSSAAIIAPEPATEAPIPRPCTGAGLVPPRYQGMEFSATIGWEPAPCCICGAVVAVDGHQRTVNHAYQEPATEAPPSELQEATTAMLADVLNVDASMMERVEAAEKFCRHMGLMWPPFPADDDDDDDEPATSPPTCATCKDTRWIQPQIDSHRSVPCPTCARGSK
jgi:hypothetical protein